MLTEVEREECAQVADGIELQYLRLAQDVSTCIESGPLPPNWQTIFVSYANVANTIAELIRSRGYISATITPGMVEAVAEQVSNLDPTQVSK
jgi:hypothetical protein